MSALNRIAYFQNRRDEIPNQVLARELAQSRDNEGIREIAENLSNKDRKIANDCIKVMYEIGYLAPDLIAEYAKEFLKLMTSRNNRMAWGTMLTLSTIAAIKADEIYPHIAEIMKVMEKGSVITMDNGVKILARVAAQKDEYRQALFPSLLEILRTCRPKSVAQYSESILVAVEAGHSQEFIRILKTRLDDLQGAQISRLKKVIREAENK